MNLPIIKCGEFGVRHGVKGGLAACLDSSVHLSSKRSGLLAGLRSLALLALQTGCVGGCKY
jgi:hypothetical protein